MRAVIAVLAALSTLALAACGTSQAEAEEKVEQTSPLETAYKECADENFDVLSYDSSHDVLMVNSLHADWHNPQRPRDNSTQSREAHHQYLQDQDEYREEVASVRASQEDIYSCIADRASIPVHVEDQIGRTRALDGTKDAEWGEFSASWTYHGSQGLNLQIIREDDKSGEE